MPFAVCLFQNYVVIVHFAGFKLQVWPIRVNQQSATYTRLQLDFVKN